MNADIDRLNVRQMAMRINDAFASLLPGEREIINVGFEENDGTGDRASVGILKILKNLERLSPPDAAVSKKLYRASFHVARGEFLGPAPRSWYPAGVEIVEVPRITCDERGADIHLTLRCEPEISKRMSWVPFEKPE